MSTYVVELNAYMEVGIGIMFIVKLVLPSRNFFGLLFMWQYLRMRYMLSEDSKVIGLICFDHANTCMLHYLNCDRRALQLT